MKRSRSTPLEFKAKDARSDPVGRSFQRGDAAAAEEVRQRVRRILNFKGYGVPHEDRLDLEQEVMTQLWQTASGPDVEFGPAFWGLVETVAARRVIDWLRVTRNHLPLETETSSRSNPLADTLAREQGAIARSILGQLPEDCRRLIQLHLGEERTYREISGILGKSEGALRVQMHRCIGTARALLRDARQTETSDFPRTEGER